jgi:hypothetical protein
LQIVVPDDWELLDDSESDVDVLAELRVLAGPYVAGEVVAQLQYSAVQLDHPPVKVRSGTIFTLTTPVGEWTLGGLYAVRGPHVRFAARLLGGRYVGVVLSFFSGAEVPSELMRKAEGRLDRIVAMDRRGRYL